MTREERAEIGEAIAHCMANFTGVSDNQFKGLVLRLLLDIYDKVNK